MQRDFRFDALSVQTVKPFVPHFNNSVGAWVNTHQEFSDGLKRHSEEQSAHFGRDINYVEVDTTDKEALGVTDEGLSPTMDNLIAKGLYEPKRTF